MTLARRIAFATLPVLVAACAGVGEPPAPGVPAAAPGAVQAASSVGTERVAAAEPALTRAALEASLGALAHDGPATPEQLSLYLPISATLDARAVASVRYADGDSWVDAHPLFRIRPEFAAEAAKAPSAFAGVVTGLAPGRTYRVEVTVSLGEVSTTRTLEATTRALPPPAGASTKTVHRGTSGTQVQALLDGALPGDVITFEDGTYEVENLVLKKSGTEERPIYVRGGHRDRVTIVDRSGRVLYLVNASHIVIENLTLEGSEADSGTAARSEGIRLWNGYTPERVTVRHLKITGVDKGIVGEGDMRALLVYDNTLAGNDVFRKDVLESNASWNDDGIRVPGRGHAVFNNMLSGFGDAMAMSSGTENVGVHFYRNRVLFTCDDAYEGDYGTRNLTFYDNRIQNSMTLASFDPLYSGPAFVFRNVAINTGRQPYKLNNTNTGMFFYNNTVVRMPGAGGTATWGWLQNNNGPLRAWGYRNNVMHFTGPNPLALESGGNDPIDFTHNAWHPDGPIWWSTSGGSYRSLREARGRLRATTPVFGASRQRHDHDVIAERNPFAVAVRFNATYDVPLETLHEPALSVTSVLRNAGVAIPGITDGFAGTRPDIGAIIAGRPAVRVGDRTEP